MEDLTKKDPAPYESLSYWRLIASRIRLRGWMWDHYVQNGRIGMLPLRLFVAEATHPSIGGTYVVSAQNVLVAFLELERITLSVKPE